jgi:formylmethanofuran dehydrogenase subunit A
MDRAYRDGQLKRVNQKLLAGSALDGRPASTRSPTSRSSRAPVRPAAGLRHKGHLGLGADADITIYAKDANAATMFATPRYVLKAGTVVVRDGQLRRAPAGRRLHVRPEYDAAVTQDVKRHFERFACVSFENYPVGPLADPPAGGE